MSIIAYNFDNVYVDRHIFAIFLYSNNISYQFGVSG